MTESIKLTRQQLYDRVWSTPAWKLGPELGMSGRGLAKLCAREGIPVPNRGYWAKKEFGWKPTQAKLPARKKDQSEDFLFSLERPEAKEKAASTRVQPPEVLVPVNLDSPHKLVKRAVSAFRRAKAGADGHLVPTVYDVLRPMVGPGTLDRALRICDGLFRFLEDRGSKVRISDKHGHATEIVIDDVVLELRIDEPLKRSDRPLTVEEKRKKSRGEYFINWDRYIYTPKGMLRIRLRDGEYRSDRGRWVDGRKPLEARLGDVAIGIDAAVARIRAQRVERAEAEVRHRERQRLEEIASHKRYVEQTRREAFDKLVGSWNHSRALRAFVDALRTQAATDGIDVSNTTRFGRWLAWAERYADDSSPLNWDLQQLPSVHRSSWAAPDAFEGDV